MTTIAPYRSPDAPGKNGFRQALHAELTKFRTVRGWIIGALVGVLAMAGVGLLASAGGTSSCQQASAYAGTAEQGRCSLSCSNTITSNLQPSTESVTVGLALKLITTWDGWKRTAILPAPSFAGCHGFSALLSSHRRGAAQMLLLPLLSSRNLYPNGWFSTDRKQRHRPRCASMQLI